MSITLHFPGVAKKMQSKPRTLEERRALVLAARRRVKLLTDEYRRENAKASLAKRNLDVAKDFLESLKENFMKDLLNGCFKEDPPAEDS
jgi:hypothetical protein